MRPAFVARHFFVDNCKAIFASRVNFETVFRQIDSEILVSAETKKVVEEHSGVGPRTGNALTSTKDPFEALNQPLFLGLTELEVPFAHYMPGTRVCLVSDEIPYQVATHQV